jgi:hypothetical protein
MSDPKQADLAAWQLEFARLFAYPVESPLLIQQRWWQALAGQPDDFELHETKQSRKVSGSINGARLSLTIDPNHIIWEIQPPPQGGPLPTLGQFREKLEWVVAKLTPWLANSCPPIRRLSFNWKLLQFAATQRKAFEILAHYLPGELIFKRSAGMDVEPRSPNDFILQMNRRRDSTVIGGLPLNRVSTWSKINVPFVVDAEKDFEWPEECYSALELQINTAPEKTKVLPPEQVPQLFRELADLGVEIADHGDIP